MEKRNKRLVIYVDPTLFGQLDKVAEKEGLTLSAYVHAALKALAEKGSS